MFCFHLVNASLLVLPDCGGDRGGSFLTRLLPSDLAETPAEASGLGAEVSPGTSEPAGAPFV